MGIRKPDANPIVSALLTWFVFGMGHIVINGQQKKWLITLVVTLIGSCLCIVPGIILAVLSVVDAYQTAVRLQAGEEIGDNEYTNEIEMLYKVCKLIDSSATCGSVSKNL